MTTFSHRFGKKIKGNNEKSLRGFTKLLQVLIEKQNYDIDFVQEVRHDGSWTIKIKGKDSKRLMKLLLHCHHRGII